MTPYEHKKFEEAEAKKTQKAAEAWHPKLSSSRRKLNSVLKEMDSFRLHQENIPLIIKLIENPNYNTSKLFGGAVDLFTHDCIHVVLGRGLLVKDEAFVIGYTMGSTKNMKRWKRNLFMFVSKYLYPEGYKFGEEERFVFNMGVIAGSLCPTDLSQINFKKYSNRQINAIRKDLKIDVDFLEKYYLLEKKCFKDVESQRLL
tara:strand:- start:129 stop:731 length:603 start_codon:yes stop_codon:yes gene_type:complete